MLINIFINLTNICILVTNLLLLVLVRHRRRFLHSEWMKIRDINISNFIWPLWAVYQNSFRFKVLIYCIREIIIIYNIVRHCEVYQLYKLRVYRQFVKLGID